MPLAAEVEFLWPRAMAAHQCGKKNKGRLRSLAQRLADTSNFQCAKGLHRHRQCRLVLYYTVRRQTHCHLGRCAKCLRITKTTTQRKKRIHKRKRKDLGKILLFCPDGDGGTVPYGPFFYLDGRPWVD
nr:hypothetical protein [Pandoravirus aubagnensis]